MDLFGNFESEKWSNGVPPSNLQTSGYEKHTVYRVTKKPEFFEYYMANSNGDPCCTFLYGALRDPLLSITNCYLKIKKINGCHVITGMIVDDDCVEINNDFLITINPPASEEKFQRKESISLGLISDLEVDQWTEKEEPPWNKSKIGYSYYSIRRNKPEVINGVLKYHLASDQGLSINAFLKGARRDPLRSIGNVYLKIDNFDEIIGIIVENDWVEKNQ
ncbi:uncharacterized protein LOC100209607 [Hydra vulgaris]|uniref:uncharacterized protein LOC100209607 n=1 Tax=Hydra vulgaris TaxID=6087 RepID=UPI00019264B3|nr:uncharacterized protein LOC100209607 [Hydra vulgaris]